MTAIWNGKEWINEEKVYDARSRYRLYNDELWNLENFINENSRELQPSRAIELRSIMDKIRKLNEI